MGVGSNPHAISISATTTPEAITEIKKHRTRQILEQKTWMVGTQKATRTDLRVWSYSNKTQKISYKQKTIRLENLL